MTARQVERIHTTPTGITRRATIRHCAKCSAVILAGLDADVCALVAHADPQPLTTHGEYTTIVSGRPTFDAVVVGRAVRLDHRDQFRIRGRRRWTVLAGHACPGVVPDLTWLPAAATVDDGEEAPF